MYLLYHHAVGRRTCTKPTHVLAPAVCVIFGRLRTRSSPTAPCRRARLYVLWFLSAWRRRFRSVLLRCQRKLQSCHLPPPRRAAAGTETENPHGERRHDPVEPNERAKGWTSCKRSTQLLSAQLLTAPCRHLRPSRSAPLQRSHGRSRCLRLRDYTWSDISSTLHPEGSNAKLVGPIALSSL
jgi:hypothetical protein